MVGSMMEHLGTHVMAEVKKEAVDALGPCAVNVRAGLDLGGCGTVSEDQ